MQKMAYPVIGVLLTFSTIFIGCKESSKISKNHEIDNKAQHELPWSKQEEDRMNLIPNIKNDKLGIELPPNVYTEWKTEWVGTSQYVVFYQDPHKKGNPPYKLFESPDIERTLFIENYGKIENEDYLMGYWVTGINELDKGRHIYDSNEVSYFYNNTMSVLKFEKSESGKYSATIYNYIFNKTSLDEASKLEKRGVKPLDSFLLNNGFDVITLTYESDVHITDNDIIVELYSNGLKEVTLELQYRENNDTLELKKIESSKENFENYLYNFGGTGRCDILKKYSTNNDLNELLSAIVQLKLDSFMYTFSSDRTINTEIAKAEGYRNLMLKYKHKKRI